jgi:hypothetical protein
MDLKERGCEGLDSTSSGQGPVAGTSDNTEGCELLDQLSLLTFSKSNLVHGVD